MKSRDTLTEESTALQAQLAATVDGTDLTRLLGERWSHRTAWSLKMARRTDLVGYAGRFATYSLNAIVPSGDEADLIRELLSLRVPVRWVSGRRFLQDDRVRWEVVFAIRTASSKELGPPHAERRSPYAAVRWPATPAGPPGPSSPQPTGPGLDLDHAWAGQVDALLKGVPGWALPPLPPVQAPPPDPSQVARLRLERIVRSDDTTGTPMAVVNGRLVSPGDVIEGVFVHSILQDRVLLGEGGEAELRSEEPVEGR